MLGAARELQFELAARIRDEIAELKKEIRQMDLAGSAPPRSSPRLGHRRRCNGSILHPLRWFRGRSAMVVARLRTADLPREQRFPMWHEAASPAHVRTFVDTANRDDFDASIELHDFTTMQLSLLSYPALRVRRTARLIRQSDPEWLHLSLTSMGQVTLNQLGREVTPETGSLVLYDTSRPCTVVNAGPVRQSVLQLPRSLLGPRVRNLTRLLATPFPADRGLGGVLSYIMLDLVRHGDSYPPAVVFQLTTTVVDLLGALHLSAAGAGAELPGEARERIRLTQIHRYIQGRLGDPGLSATEVAQTHGMSLRQLNRIFQRHGATPAWWIRQQRLERCRRDLIDPAEAGRSAAAIGARWGFIDPGTFNRVFRREFGMPPGEYRRLGAIPGDQPRVGSGGRLGDVVPTGD